MHRPIDQLQKEELYSIIIDTSQTGVAIFDAVRDAQGRFLDFSFRYLNEAAAAIVGHSSENLIGKRYLNHFSQAESSGLFATYRQVLETGIPNRLHNVPYKADGIDGWFDIQIRRQGDSIIVVFNDISEPVRAAQVAETQRLLLDNVLNLIEEAVYVLEPMYETQTGKPQLVDFRYKQVNKFFEKIYKRTADEVVGKSYLDIRKFDKKHYYVDIFRQVLESGETYEKEVFFQSEAEGLDGWFHITIMKMGNLILGSTRDITRAKEIALQLEANNESLQKTTAELQRSNEELVQFAQVASHDLQEPLRKIQVFTDILTTQLTDNLSPGEQDLALRLRQAAQRMQQLIRDLLNYSQMAGEHLRFVEVSLGQVTDDVLSDLSLLITEKKAVITVEPLPTIKGNESRLRQLFQNLISNALKFQLPTQEPVIHIRSARIASSQLPEGFIPLANQDYYRISVQDNGIGFEAERYQNKLFKLFQRLHERRKYAGTGIGLAVCMRVAESHGGTISVESAPGVGTTFHVFLPEAAKPQ